MRTPQNEQKTKRKIGFVTRSSIKGEMRKERNESGYRETESKR